MNTPADNAFPMVPLGEVLTKSKEQIEISPQHQYKQVTIKLWGQGVMLRDEVEGAAIAGTKRFVVRPQQFILSRIDARNGAFGLVPDSLDGAVVSNDFPAFTPDASRLLPAFLGWMSKTHGFVDLCRAASEGTTNRVRLKEHLFMATKIPLPPLPEQRRIVARIEDLAARIEEARELRRQAVEEAEALLGAEEMRVWSEDSLHGAPMLSEVTNFLSRGRQSRQGDSDHYLIKTQHVQMGRYVESDMTLAPDVASKVRAEATVREGDVLIACSAAGCLGRVAYYADAGRTASTDTHVAIARADSNAVLSDYLYKYLKGSQGQIQLRSREKGDWQREKVGFRLTELNLADLKRVPVPLPSVDEQRRIVAYLDELQAKVDSLKRLQAETAAELDALLPSVLDRACKGRL